MIPVPPPRLNLAQLPTPLQPLDRLSAHLSANLKAPRIWLKRDDLSEFGCSGNKIRKLEFLMADAQSQAAKMVITCGGLQSNHCRATALIAAKLGLKCHLILRGEEPDQLDANTLLAKLAGASLSFYPPSQWSKLSQYFQYWHQFYSEQGHKCYDIPTGGSNGLGLWGYICAAEEIEQDLREQGIGRALICCATGSGGTHSGLALGLHLLQSQHSLRAYAVCDSAQYFERKGQQDIEQWNKLGRYFDEVPKPLLDINDDYIGEGYALANQQVMDCIRLLAKLEGIILDPVYTGKAFSGLMDQILQGELSHFDDIVFVHTGGTFGLFPFRDQI